MTLTGTAVGTLGAALTFLVYLMRSPIALRRVAIVANATLIGYGIMAHSLPTLLLHCALLPLNFLRLRELMVMRRDIERALEGDVSPTWLASFMTRKTLKAGAYVFRKGDAARDLYYLEAGTVRLVELGIDLHAHEVFGEIAFFAKTRSRMSSAVCAEDVVLRTLTHDALLDLYQRDPTFGLFLVHLITARLQLDMERSKPAAVD
ncbi:MAG: Crp/Fnr family transcriptional regulator [Candidatus Velthaea sp.]